MGNTGSYRDGLSTLASCVDNDTPIDSEAIATYEREQRERVERLRAAQRVGPMESDFISPRFEPGDPMGMQYLREQGYVVIGPVATEEDIAKGEDLFWGWMDGLGTGIERGVPSTWDDPGWPAVQFNGLINGDGIGQSDFLWYARCLPRVRTAFEQLWGTPRLLVSMDGCGVFRPFKDKPEWKTRGGWFHVDQDGKRKPGLHCVQGLVSLYDQNATTGGLVVIPRSHEDFQQVCADTPSLGGDYIPIPKEHPVMKRPSRLVHCQAGDLVLWDSRTIHCNSPAVETPTGSNNEVLRLVAYLCMTPAAKASRKTIQRRQEGYNTHTTTTHWPHEFHLTALGKNLPRKDFNAAPPDIQCLVVGSKPIDPDASSSWRTYVAVLAGVTILVGGGVTWWRRRKV